MTPRQLRAKWMALPAWQQRVVVAGVENASLLTRNGGLSAACDLAAALLRDAGRPVVRKRTGGK